MLTDPFEKEVIVSFGKSAFSSKIIQRKITLEKLFKLLSKPTNKGQYSEKNKDGKYFIFAAFNSNNRNLSNLRHYYGACIDIDGGQISLKQIHSKLRLYTYCVHSTFSHRMKGKGTRYRVIIPYKHLVTPGEHVDLILYFLNRLGFDEIDLSSKTLSLPMYLPAVNIQNEKHFVFRRNKGLLFDPHSSALRNKITSYKFEYNELNKQSPIVDLDRELLEGERNQELTRIIGKFIRTGISQKDLLPMAMSFNRNKIKPPLSEKDVKTIVDSVVKTHTRNHSDLQWGFDEIMRRCSDKITAKSEFQHICKMISYGKLKNRLTPSQLEMLIAELHAKTGTTKKTINQELVAASYDIQGKEQEILEETIKEQSESLKEKFSDWVYIGTEDKLYNFYTGETYKKEAFNAMFHTPDLKAGIFGVLTKYNIIKKVSRMEFDPTRDTVYERENIMYVNTYIQPDIEPEKGPVRRLLNHFEYLFSDEYERNIVLDFIAHLVQFPGKKIRWMLIIKGGKGVGKTVIAEQVLANILGLSNVGKVDNKLVRSNFNSWQIDKQLIVFEELMAGTTHRDKVEFTDSLKAFITDDLMKAHRKGVDPYDVVNKSCTMGFTNYEDPIVITFDERRFCMIKTDAKPKPDKYYEQFVEYCQNKRGQIYRYFLRRNIKNFGYMRAPETEYTKQLKMRSVQWPGSTLLEIIEDELENYDDYGCLTYSQIVDLIEKRSSGKFKYMAQDLKTFGSGFAKNLSAQLYDFGFTKMARQNVKDQRFFIGGKKEVVYILPGEDNYHKVYGQTTKEITKNLSSLKIDKNTDFDDI